MLGGKPRAENAEIAEVGTIIDGFDARKGTEPLGDGEGKVVGGWQ